MVCCSSAQEWSLETEDVEKSKEVPDRSMDIISNLSNTEASVCRHLKGYLSRLCVAVEFKFGAGGTNSSIKGFFKR
jgi:hypothetical protein